MRPDFFLPPSFANSSQYVQLIIIPVLFTFAAFIGIVVTSAGNVLYGSYIWDPLRLIDKWDNRAAAFFASFSFALATLGTNISANSISAANDFTALAPKVCLLPTAYTIIMDIMPLRTSMKPRFFPI